MVGEILPFRSRCLCKWAQVTQRSGRAARKTLTLLLKNERMQEFRERGGMVGHREGGQQSRETAQRAFSRLVNPLSHSSLTTCNPPLLFPSALLLLLLSKQHDSNALKSYRPLESASNLATESSRNPLKTISRPLENHGGHVHICFSIFYRPNVQL